MNQQKVAFCQPKKDFIRQQVLVDFMWNWVLRIFAAQRKWVTFENLMLLSMDNG